MTVDRTREVIASPPRIDGGYNFNTVRPLLGDVRHTQVQPAVHGSIREFDL